MNRLGDRIARLLARGLAAALAGAALGGCTAGGLPGDAQQPAPASSSSARSGTSPLHNPDGTKPGLAPVTAEQDRAAARELIARVSVKGRGPKTGYDRDEFGYAWMDTADGVPLARNGCDTRNDLLARDGQDLRFRSGSDCVVIAMTLHDPYTGRDIAWQKAEATAVQIDHVVSVAATTKSSRSPL